MMASRGMGDINPSKMPGAKKKARRDNTDFTQYAEGGKVNAAGNYTKPGLRKRILSQVKSAATQGTGAGQWSARKAQLVAKKYKAAGILEAIVFPPFLNSSILPCRVSGLLIRCKSARDLGPLPNFIPLLASLKSLATD